MAILSKGNETKILIGVAFVGAYLIYKTYGAGQSIKEVVTTKLNPASSENIVAKSVDSVVQTVSGGKSKTLGSALYCLFNSDSYVCNPELVNVAAKYNLSYKVVDVNGDEVVNPQVIDIYNQEKEFNGL